VTAVTAAAAPPALEARGLTRELGAEVKTRVLGPIDLAIAPGELVSITGPSGSGKSTLLYLLGLLDRPTAGEVLIDGVAATPLDDLARGALRGTRLGFVFQFHFLLPEFTAAENVALPMLRHGAARADALARAEEVLASLGLGGLGGRRPTQLSGGQQQRVSIARAIAHRPKILFADEPTGNLDSAAGLAVMTIFDKLVADDHLTIVLVTHEPSYAARADREVRLLDGRIVEIVAPPPNAARARPAADGVSQPLGREPLAQAAEAGHVTRLA
jgi:lipoprotein-releasing system ATP-binding protein